jgi:hypothetical protein
VPEYNSIARKEGGGSGGFSPFLKAGWEREVVKLRACEVAGLFDLFLLKMEDLGVRDILTGLCRLVVHAVASMMAESSLTTVTLVKDSGGGKTSSRTMPGGVRASRRGSGGS